MSKTGKEWLHAAALSEAGSDAQWHRGWTSRKNSKSNKRATQKQNFHVNIQNDQSLHDCITISKVCKKSWASTVLYKLHGHGTIICQTGDRVVVPWRLRCSGVFEWTKTTWSDHLQWICLNHKFLKLELRSICSEDWEWSIRLVTFNRQESTLPQSKAMTTEGSDFDPKPCRKIKDLEGEQTPSLAKRKVDVFGQDQQFGNSLSIINSLWDVCDMFVTTSVRIRTDIAPWPASRR